MPFIDCHCHLHFGRIAKCVDSIVSEARRQGVEGFVVNGTGPEDWNQVRLFAESHPGVLPSYGIHPYTIDEKSDVELLKAFCLQQRGAFMIGEIGMDKTISRRVSLSRQESLLEQQVCFAKEKNIPFAVHCVKCVNSVYEVLSRHGPFPTGFIMHGYSGPSDFVSKFAVLGAFFSFSCYYLNVSPDRQRGMEDTIRKVPEDRLLFESDAPDMVAREEHAFTVTDDEGSKTNTPCCIPYVWMDVASNA